MAAALALFVHEACYRDHGAFCMMGFGVASECGVAIVDVALCIRCWYMAQVRFDVLRNRGEQLYMLVILVYVGRLLEIIWCGRAGNEA